MSELITMCMYSNPYRLTLQRSWRYAQNFDIAVLSYATYTIKTRTSVILVITFIL